MAGGGSESLSLCTYDLGSVGKTGRCRPQTGRARPRPPWRLEAGLDVAAPHLSAKAAKPLWPSSRRCAATSAGVVRFSAYSWVESGCRIVLSAVPTLSALFAGCIPVSDHVRVGAMGRCGGSPDPCGCHLGSALLTPASRAAMRTRPRPVRAHVGCGRTGNSPARPQAHERRVLDVQRARRRRLRTCWTVGPPRAVLPAARPRASTPGRPARGVATGPIRSTVRECRRTCPRPRRRPPAAERALPSAVAE